MLRDGKLDAHDRRVTNAELEKLLEYKDQVNSLDLSNNQLRAFPAFIGNLTSLRHLNLSHNQLQTLPESLGNLGSLGNLDLEKKQLRTIPGTLGNLINLRILNFSGNRFFGSCK